MTCKWCPVYVSSANGLNRVHKSGGLNFTGLHRLRFLPCRWQARSVWAAEKTWTLPFLPRATDASLLLAGKTRWAVVAGEKIERYLFSHAATDASLLLAGNTRRAVMAVEKVDRYLVSPQTRCPACWNSLPKEDAENLNGTISTHSPKRLHCWDSPGTIYTSYRLR